MAIEDMMQEALDMLHRDPEVGRLGFCASATTDACVIDADVNHDGKLDDNPDLGVGTKPGYFTLRVYPVWEPPAEPPLPVLVLDEVAVQDLGLKTAEELHAHVMSQLRG